MMSGSKEEKNTPALFRQHHLIPHQNLHYTGGKSSPQKLINQIRGVEMKSEPATQ